jgi:hypothetical protein
MALMERRSSEALARRASVGMSGETVKRWPLRGEGQLGVTLNMA